MLLKIGLNAYNVCLSLGAFYLGILMIAGKGAFDTYPPEWIGILPFHSWMGFALFGMIIFGFGNGIASIYGLRKKDKKNYTMTFTMGILFCFATVISTILIDEWLLPTGVFLLLSIIQIALGLLGLVIYFFTNRVFT